MQQRMRTQELLHMYTIDMKCHKHVPDLPAKLRKEMERIK